MLPKYNWPLMSCPIVIHLTLRLINGTTTLLL